MCCGELPHMARKELDADEKFGLAWILGWPIYALILMMAMNFLTSISHWLDKLDPEIDPERAQEWALNHEAQIAAEDARLEGIRTEVTNLLPSPPDPRPVPVSPSGAQSELELQA